jgi:putative ABC transport system permease protein
MRLRGLPRSFRFPWRSASQIRSDVDDELAFHLAERIDALQRAGLGGEAARNQALRELGGLERTRERLVAQDARGERRSQRLRILGDGARDLRIAFRSLRRAKTFTAVAVMVLALGIGIMSGAFNLVNVYALKPALAEAPERLLSVFALHSETRRGRIFSYAEYAELRDRATTFSSLTAYMLVDVGVEEGAVTRRLASVFVSANYFDTLGVPPARGRGFTLAEERGEEPAAAVVSHDFWVRNGADPNVVGTVVRVNGQPLTVVGVAARGFTGHQPLFGPDVWLPLAALDGVESPDDGEEPLPLRDPQNRSLLIFGRLARGTAPAEAEAELAALAGSIAANPPDPNGVPYTYVVGEIARFSISNAPHEENLLADGLLPLAMSAVVLLIACLNLANMFLARGATRRTEMAIRQSLGSGRLRLVRQLLTEGLLLALLGGALGLTWTYWGTTWVAAALTKFLPNAPTVLIDMRPDLRVLLVTAATCIAATLLFGLGPAWRVTGLDVLSGLKESAGAAPRGRRGRRTLLSGRSLLIVGQIALSLVMLTAGGLFLRSALAAANATPNFSLDSTLLIELDPSLVGNDEIRSRALYAEVMARLRALPEVDAAGLASAVPFDGISRFEGIQPAGYPPGEGTAFGRIATIGDDFFDALRLPMLRGRDFTPAESTSGAGPPVAIVDEILARRLFPDSEALGRQIEIASTNPDAAPVAMEIVGIAPGVPGAETDPAPRSLLYLPFGRSYTAKMHVVLAIDDRVPDPAGLLDTIRTALREIDGSLPVLRLTTMREFRDRNWQLWILRVGGQLFTFLGAVALVVAMVGLYGVTAFLMSRRTREIGVRMALGATRGAVLRQMLRENLALTAVGLAVGWLLSLGVGRILASMLYEVGAADPWVFLGATAFLALCAAVASWLPVRNALRIEPSAALRYE